MRREQIELGVEYAEHGPQAYGRIPNNRPARVRFISKDPNTRLVETLRKEENGWRPVGKAHTKQYASHPTSLYVKEARDLPIGDTFTVWYPSLSPVGALPSEVTYDDGKTWFLHMSQPAGVHMTWAEYAEQQRASVERGRRNKLDAAPAQMGRAWANLVEAARLQGMTKRDILTWVSDRLKEMVM